MKRFFGLIFILCGSLFNTESVAKEPKLLPPMVMTLQVQEPLAQVYVVKRDFWETARLVTEIIACTAIVACALLEWYAEYRAFKNGKKNKRKNKSNNFDDLYWLISSSSLDPF